MQTSIEGQLVLLLVAVPYIGAWWWALRILCAKRFVPWEWVPLAVASLGVPLVLNEFLYESPLRSMRWIFVGCWMALPMPVIMCKGVIRVMARWQ
jgi:hypothetical protein